jgi:hypothetical protein
MDFDALDTTCDGLFLLLDTARHNNVTATEEEVAEHIRECPECFERNAEHLPTP